MSRSTGIQTAIDRIWCFADEFLDTKETVNAAFFEMSLKNCFAQNKIRVVICFGTEFCSYMTMPSTHCAWHDTMKFKSEVFDH